MAITHVELERHTSVSSLIPEMVKQRGRKMTSGEMDSCPQPCGAPRIPGSHTQLPHRRTPKSCGSQLLSGGN